jgi:hypothetical protein
MRAYVSIAVLATITLVPLGLSSPIDGTYGKKNKVTEQPWRTTRTFQAGERASVFALGNRADDEVVGKLHIKVLDAKGNLIAEDQGNSNVVGDFAGVTWYPPRTAEYRIEVHSAKANEVYIAIK